MRKKQTFQWPELTAGVCYYPEHWPEFMWAEDLRRMKDSGIEYVRIGEFAWSILEPREGEFTYGLFDRFLELTREVNMKVIFGTPTATPPAWLTEKYPEVLNCRQDGVPYRHGMRRHYNYNSPKYQELSKRIVEVFASRYAPHPQVVGWQIDNELNCETDVFYSESDTLAFREFLKKKYGTLAALNDAWGTVFWNQTYSAWEEIYVPRLTVHAGSTNPHHTLDFIRFVSDSAVHFAKMQSDIIRKYQKPGDFITTNGMFGHLDNHRLTDEALDVYTYDSYPNFAFTLDSHPKTADNLNDRRWSDHLAEVRSICPHFGIMEQQSGAMGWHTRMESPAPKPGQMQLWAMQSVAHGADFVSFFRWRTATMGNEIYWHGLLDYDNRDNRKIRELKSFHNQLKSIRDMAGAEYKAAFAVLRDYDNVWDAGVDKWHTRLTWASEEEIFVGAQLSHTPMDYLYLQDSTEVSELLKYPVLIYPHALILTPERAALLKAYVEAGGTLVLGARCGQKDETGKCVMQPMPGLLSGLTGTTVDDYTFVGPNDDPVSMELAGQMLPTGIFNDVLSAGDDCEVLARYAGNYYAGAPALVSRACGKGRVLHFGGTFTREFVGYLLGMLNAKDPWADVLTLPADCELAVREKEGKRWFFLLNYSPKACTAQLHTQLTDTVTGEKLNGEILLKPYEVKVLV